MGRSSGVARRPSSLVTEMAGEGPKKMEDYPPVGTSIRARVLWHNDERQQVSWIFHIADDG